ncbi:MAG: hemolysin III family protein [Candidatus Bipolaricaulota bacterium]|nr:hemolysin III family protein [Candidatus Bipolaricaulota bacterium]
MDKDTAPKHQLPEYTLGEEIANSVTHGIGALLSLIGTAILLYRAVRDGTTLHVISFAVYGSCLFLLHLSSTLYHALRPPRAKRVFRVFDHCSIYLLIAGTYTPFLLLSLWGRWGLTLLIAIWTLAVAGIVFKSLFIGRLQRTSVLLYILMGWMIIVAAREAWIRVPHAAIGFVAAGGLFYTLGVAFYAWKSLPYNHAVWHLFVLGGSVCHYAAILLYLMPHA